MKTMAIRLEDDVSQQLTMIAQLEATSVAELIREAIGNLIIGRRDTGALAERAEAILADIDREAAARREAIQSLLGSPPSAGTTAGRGRGRRGDAAAPDET
jgi:predicted DNA-binding protein